MRTTLTFAADVCLSSGEDPGERVRLAVLRGGVRYERMVLEWRDEVEALVAHAPSAGPGPGFTGGPR